ncbi:MAG: YifB family Mg chelatase-like AAA ATPase [Alphaproteobacteria bacterium]|nr:YifB family Mg chelatase-like AAA ATPase [Alphaproteobacteria bacterium]
MYTHINTLTFNGLEVQEVDLQAQISSGLPNFIIVGLPDKAIAESKERVRAAMTSLGLQLPPKRIVINLAPADLLKEGSHFDLPIALGILAVMGIVSVEKLKSYIVIGELGLDGEILPVNGVLPVAVYAAHHNLGIICPQKCGTEAAWAQTKEIIAAPSLVSLVNHLKGSEILETPQDSLTPNSEPTLDMSDGGHNLVMVGPPGSGKSMVAARLPSILPPMTLEETLQTSMIKSIAGELIGNSLCFERPFRAPHHSASTPALVGGGRRGTPGEISLAHNGVLFLDELPEFNRPTLEALRQPLENGQINISRVNAHTSYPADFQLIAAMNPCRCGYLGNKDKECTRAPICAKEYMSKISGPLLDRIDIKIEVPPVNPWDLADIKKGESSKTIQARVIAARKIQTERLAKLGLSEFTSNASLKGKILEEICQLEKEAETLLITFAEKNSLSARAYHRTLRLARTIADLQNESKILKLHVAEALAYRQSQYF